MQRYFRDEIDLVNMKCIIEDDKIRGNDYHHIRNVLKHRLNEKIIICTPNGKQYLGKIIRLVDYIEIDLLEEITNNTEIDASICVAHGLARKDRQKEVIRKLVELGCSEYVAVQMEYCSVKLKDDFESILTQFNKLIKESSEQSERSLLMKYHEPIMFKDFINFSKDYEVKLFCYERSTQKEFDYKSLKKKKTIILLGPEGGFNDKELQTLRDNGFSEISLGKRILRTETAPISLMTLIAHYVGERDEN